MEGKHQIQEGNPCRYCGFQASLGKFWDEKFHRGGAKLTQAKNADCSAVVAAPLDGPFGKNFLRFRTACIDSVFHVAIGDHATAFLAPRSPVQNI